MPTCRMQQCIYSLLVLTVAKTAFGVMTECEVPKACKKFKMESCIITSFRRWPKCKELDVLKLRGVKIMDPDGCSQWLQNVTLIREELIAKADDGVQTTGFGECVKKLKHPLKYGPGLSDVEVEGIELLDESWLHTNGSILFSDMANKTTEDFEISRQNLTSANLSLFLPRISVVKSLTLNFNNFTIIRERDFEQLNLALLPDLQIAYNQICVFYLSALGSFRKLSRVNLTGNPLYVDSTTFLSWARSYKHAIAWANDGKCASVVTKYRRYPVVEKSRLTDVTGFHEVILSDPDGCYTKKRLGYWVYALIATGIFAVSGLAVAFFWWRKVRIRLAVAKSALEEVAVLRQSSNVYDAEIVDKDDESETYERVVDSVYEEMQEVTENQYAMSTEDESNNTNMPLYASPKNTPINEDASANTSNADNLPESQ